MIVMKNIYKSFENESEIFHALEDVSLKIQEGEMILIQGESGSGKSTLLSILGLLMKPTSGSVEIKGENIVSFSDIHTSDYRKNEIGFITQNFHLFEELTVKDNLLAPLVLHPLSPYEIEKKIENALTIANIHHKKEQVVSSLSRGEKQRCIIARALVNNPKILICDEPTANLDVKNSLLFIETLKKLKKNGRTIILATHDTIFENLTFIDQKISLKEGKID